MAKIRAGGCHFALPRGYNRGMTRGQPTNGPEAGEPLAGQIVAMPESRRLDVFASMLEKRGASVYRCPLVAIHDSPDEASVHRWLDALIAGQFDDVILYTGEGTRRLAGFAQRGNCHDAFVEALGQARKITRGPKPVQALRELGLKSDLAAEAPTTDGLLATLRTLDLSGRTVGVQMYGQRQNERLAKMLNDAGATVDFVHPYVYASQAEDSAVVELIEALGQGRINTIAFTSEAQVDRLWQVAERASVRETLERGLARTYIAAVGPVVGAALERRGLTIDAMPDEPFALKPLMNAMIEAQQRMPSGS